MVADARTATGQLKPSTASVRVDRSRETIRMTPDRRRHADRARVPRRVAGRSALPSLRVFAPSRCERRVQRRRRPARHRRGHAVRTRRQAGPCLRRRRARVAPSWSSRRAFRRRRCRTSDASLSRPRVLVLGFHSRFEVDPPVPQRTLCRACFCGDGSCPGQSNHRAEAFVQGISAVPDFRSTGSPFGPRRIVTAEH